ncbi:galactose-1-phosphate uridylyltransferase [Microaceticoccus formicicus]|uniref:galactose-1-phosphate uridylyltransferase n=1 Tax=Microaceticoccus formicicus TaxID=3118105 RepID=UPI003CD02609|nr:galactose-1-phosphate uridylyltransferase [Peptoniphilaceae bacterium AMB_02]
MAELRYNPLLDDYTMVAGSRDKRPNMPKDYCPFCPGSGKVPDEYDVYKYDNDFPMLSTNPPQQDDVAGGPYHTKESYGKCDVILYSPDHNGKLWELSEEHLIKLVKLWIDRFTEISEDSKIKYVFPFENRGAEVGTTMPHPHGQIYGYSFMPKMVDIELKNAQSYYENNKSNLYDDMLAEEIRFKDRLVYENETFTAFIPFFAQYPYGIYIFNKCKLSSFKDFKSEHIKDFADILKTIVGSYDILFNRDFPYMMGIYNAPVNSEEYSDAEDFFRFHVKFFPPLRGEHSIKWNASSETAAGAYGNPRVSEQTAGELREAVERFNETH